MKKKILITTDAWHPQLNGVVHTITETANTLRRMGYEVDIASPQDFKGIPLDRVVNGLKLTVPPIGIGKRIEAAAAIHISTEGTIGLATKLYCDRRGIDYTTGYHTNFPEYAERNYRIPSSWVQRYMRWFHKKSRAVMVPTRNMIAELQGHGFNNCVLWGRGVDSSVFNRFGGTSNDDFERPIWLSVGRVSKEKNLEAFLGLDLPGTKVVVGDGPDRKRLEKKYPDAKFLGIRKGISLADTYRNADSFCFSSRFDTYGLVNAEAISCGLPVAAYPVTGPIDIIEQGVTGYLDDDLRTACLKSLEIKNVKGDFSWEHATEQFVSHLTWKSTPNYLG